MQPGHIDLLAGKLAVRGQAVAAGAGGSAARFAIGAVGLADAGTAAANASLQFVV